MDSFNKDDPGSAIGVAIIGAEGKMGILACESIKSMPGYFVAAKIGRNDNLDQALKQVKPKIAIELTSHLSVLKNSRIIIENGIHPVIGSSGLLAHEVSDLVEACGAKNLGGLIIPNFSLGIACINKLSVMLKEHFSQFSLLEFHHTKKKDKPSGTARHMAQLLEVEEDKIASIRSDGFLAKLQIYASSQYERIMIDHESFERKSFHSGICLSVKKVSQLNEMIVGLEHIV